MSERRRKRRLVNAVLVLLLIAAVLHLYVASSGAADWLVGRGTLELATATALDRTVFAPLDWYCNANGPGATTIDTFRCWSHWKGVGMPQDWNELSSVISRERKQGNRFLIQPER